MGVVVALGSNLGDRLAHLQRGLDGLPEVVAVSGVYETEPVGGPAGQGRFLNAVALLGAGVTARQAFEAGQQAEAEAGRERTTHWGPRTLDVDVVSADEASSEPDLVVPHPRAAQRAFVLLPWLDVDATAALDGVAVRDLIAGLDVTGVTRTSLRLELAV